MSNMYIDEDEVRKMYEETEGPLKACMSFNYDPCVRLITITEGDYLCEVFNLDELMFSYLIKKHS